MSLGLTRDGKRLRSWVVHVDVGNCSSSPTRNYNLALAIHLSANHPMRVRADGSFAERARFRVQTDAGQKLYFKVHLNGKTARTRATGTIRVSGPRDPSGNVVDRCDSGPVRWKLRRGKVYGGETADGTPLSIRLNRDGSRLKSFFIDVLIVCDSTNSLLIGAVALEAAGLRD